MAGEKQVKILEISSYPPPHAGWGVRVSYLRRSLESLGHQCSVLNIGKSRKIKSAEYLDVQGGIDYLKKVIRHASQGFLIHTHVNGDSPKGLILVLVAELASLLNRRRCVLTFHAGPVQHFFPKNRSRLLAPVFRMIFAIPRRIICNNTAVKEKIITYGVSEEKIVPIPAFSRQYLQYSPQALSSDMEDFLGRRRPILTAYFFDRPEFFVDSMIQAMTRLTSKFPEAGFVLIGGDTRSDRIMQLVEKAGLMNHVYFAGDRFHDEFMTILSKSHFFIRTPQKDGVSASVLEALSLKIPVVASENGSRPPGVITFKPNDAVELEEKIASAWNRYNTVRSGIVLPEIRDTVEEEATLLINLA